MSLPSRERGLKLPSRDVLNTDLSVAPFAGAWIEIQKLVKILDYLRSLPSRERGLKYLTEDIFKVDLQSLPSRERGLKSSFFLYLYAILCRSLRGSVD